MSLNNRGSDGWSPISGTGYPYSGQAFVYSPTALNYDPSQTGANVPSSSDTSPSITQIYVFISGTVSPDQTSSWYQWTSGGIGRASVPNNQVAGVFASGINVSGNSIYTTPANENLSNYQIAGKYQFSVQSGTTANSGVSNVPFSESSWNV